MLDLLVRRCEEQKDYVKSVLTNEYVKRSVVTRGITVKNVRATTEKSVSSLTQEIILNARRSIRTGIIPDSDLTKIAAKSQDRMDLFIECDIESDNKAVTAKSLQIIVENKIDAGEGGKKQGKKTGVDDYDDAPQTTRYYMGTRFSALVGGKAVSDYDTWQLYVYLTPQEPREGGCADPHYVQISYQDIVDSILTPMLASASLSTRSRFFIEEFRNQLLFPTIEGTMMHPAITTSEQFAEEITLIWNRYQPLLTHAAITASEASLWTIDGTYYDHQPRAELLEMLLERGVQSPNIINGQWKPRMQYAKMQELASSFNIKTDVVRLAMDDDTQELLASFWDKNKRLLTAMMNRMDAEERMKAQALFTQLSKRDTTKYSVFYDNKPVGMNLGKAQTAFCVINLWTKLLKEEGKDVTLDLLRETFTRKFNPYYENGKWFKFLFYEETASLEYDGEKTEGPVSGNWDFDKKGRFSVETTDGKKVAMLRMWRKDGLEHLIEMMKQKKLFKGSLDVVPVD